MEAELKLSSDRSRYDRVNDGFLKAIEKPALEFFSKKIPDNVSPDELTMLGIAGAVLATVCNIMTNWYSVFLLIAPFGIALNWFGDSLDGTIARMRGTERVSVGFYIDHTADLFSQVCVILTLGSSFYIRFDTACLMLGAYLCASVFTFVRLHAVGVFYLTQNGFGPTELRFTLVVGYLGAFVIGAPTWQIADQRFSMWDIALGGLAVITFFSTFYSAARLYFKMRAAELKS